MAARSGDDVAIAELLTRYRWLARSKARSYFIAGGDRDDVVQEAMIGLYKAVRDFDPSHGVAFAGFADLCVTRQVITAVKAATRYKHGPLRHSISLDAPTDRSRGGTQTVADTLCADVGTDPAEIVVSAAAVRRLGSHLDAVLSDLEADVLRLLLEGHSYVEIAQAVGRHTKTVDNAIQRLRRKLAEHLVSTAVE